MTIDAQTSRRPQDAVVSQTGASTSLTFIRELPRFSSDRVWSALTDPKEVEGWLGHLDVTLYEGGPFRLKWLNADQDGNYAVTTGTITSLMPYRELTLESDLHGEVCFELQDMDAGCRVKFVNTRPADADKLTSILAGWHTHLDFLEEILEGTPVDWDNWPVDRWQANHDHYANLQPRG